MTVIRPAGLDSTASDDATRFAVVEVCTAADQHPSGREATYVSGRRHGQVFDDWARAHEAHGFVRAEER